MERSDVINGIIKKYNMNNPHYLEIGVWYGNTFGNVNSINKDGVDPEQYVKSDFVNYKMTSDEFFKNHITKKYDIIFVDGLHTAHQVTKDIINSINNLNLGGFLVLDDVFPHCEREQESLDLKKTGPQTGDVWKAVYNILDDLESISSDKFFIKENERGNLVLKIECIDNTITIDNTIPSSNTDGFNPCEWNKFTYKNDFNTYLNRFNNYNSVL